MKIDKMCPIIPKFRKIDSSDEVTPNTLIDQNTQLANKKIVVIPKTYHPETCKSREVWLLIRTKMQVICLPLRNEAIASAATKIGRTAATTAD